jgi:hypothetical protein
VRRTAGKLHPLVGPSTRRVQDEGEAAAGQQETRQVDSAGGRLAVLLLEEEAEQEGGHANGHVDEEHPAPRQLVNQQTSEDGTRRGCDHSWDDEDAGNLHALCGRERSIQHGGAHRSKRTTSGALHKAEEHQQREVSGQPTQG